MDSCNLNLESDSSSSSEDENYSIFRSVCDPTFSAAYATKSNGQSHVNTSSAIEQVTGDEELDKAISGLKNNFINTSDNTNLIFKESSQYPAATALFSRNSSNTISRKDNLLMGTKAPLPYVVKFFSETMDKKLKLRKCNSKLSVNSEESDSSASKSSEDNLVIHGSSGVNKAVSNVMKDNRDIHTTLLLQLLPSVVYDPTLPVPRNTDSSNKWMKDLKRRQGYFYSSDEESEVERRCRDVALSREFIESGGLRDAYAEHRNRNPKKVERVRLLKKGSGNGILRIAPRLPKKDEKNNNGSKLRAQSTSSSAGGNKVVSQVKKSAPNEDVAQQQTNELPLKRKKVKSRKRGKKKKKSKDEVDATYLTSVANGDS